MSAFDDGDQLLADPGSRSQVALAPASPQPQSADGSAEATIVHGHRVAIFGYR